MSAQFRVWQPHPDGRSWVPSRGRPGWASLGDAEDDLLDDHREAVRDEDGEFLIVWSVDDGYLAAAPDGDDLPEPLELLAEEEDRFAEGELDEKPTLLGEEGEPPPWGTGDEAELGDLDEE